MTRIMGLDVGDKTVGVAISDPLFVTAQPYETIKRRKAKFDIDRIEEIINDKEISLIVVGLPKNMNNTIGPQSMKVMSFVDLIKKRIDIDIVYEDDIESLRLKMRYEVVPLIKEYIKDGILRGKKDDEHYFNSWMDAKCYLPKLSEDSEDLVE